MCQRNIHTNARSQGFPAEQTKVCCNALSSMVLIQVYTLVTSSKYEPTVSPWVCLKMPLRHSISVLMQLVNCVVQIDQKKIMEDNNAHIKGRHNVKEWTLRTARGRPASTEKCLRKGKKKVLRKDKGLQLKFFPWWINSEFEYFGGLK